MINSKALSILFVTVQILITTGCSGNIENTEKIASQNTEPTSSSASAIEDTYDSVSQSNHAATTSEQEELFIFKKDGKDGFINFSGQWVIQPKYEVAYPFIEGLALVKLEGKFLLIDRKGQPLPLPEGVTETSTFQGGLAPVTINGKTGFINRSGRLMTKPVLDLPATEMALPSEGMRMVLIDSLFTFVDSTGKIIRQPGFEYALDFFEGFALVSNQGRYGYIDKTGTISIPMNYNVAWSFSEGLAMVGVADGENIQFSFIDHSGKTVIPIPYKVVNPRFTNGLTFFGIEKEGKRKYGFIDRKGKVVIEPVYDKVEEIASSASKDFGYVLAYKVKTGEQYGLVSGAIKVSPAFSEISPFHEGLAAASTGSGDSQKFGFIDTKGKWVIKPEYDAANDFSHGLAAVRKGALIGGVWGYIDIKGKMVIAPQFRFAYNFLGDIAMVQKGNKKAIINKAGKVLIEE